MTKLLISIANESEAKVLVGVIARFEEENFPNPIGIVDLKDPQQGALGFVGATTADAIIRSLGPSFTKSVALGELSDHSNGQRASLPGELLGWGGRSSLDSDIQFAKIGLAGMGGVKGWQSHWTDLMRSFPESVQPVGVAYLDAKVCDSPEIEEVLELVVDHGEAALLLDTFDKSSGNAISIAGIKKLQQIISVAQFHDVLTVVAGSVKASELAEINSLEPDFIGVRGAVCADGRTQLDSSRLASFLETFCNVCGSNSR